MSVLLHLSPLAAIGGCETNCLRVIEGLPEHRHRVLVFDAPGPMSARWENAGAEVVHLSEWRSGPRKFREAFSNWVGRQDRPSGVFYWSTSRLPEVLDAGAGLGSSWCVYLGNPARSEPLAALRRWWYARLRSAPARVTLVGCSLQVVKSHCGAHYFRRFASEVIYNAVAPEYFRPRVHRALNPGSVPRIGMVARLDRIKDHMTLIRALAAELGLAVEFAGDGPWRWRLESEARRLGVADRVHFLGFRNVAPLLETWDIYVHSTTAHEGMGTAVAEAMAAGLPCLVSDLPVMREVCGDAACYAAAGDPAAFGRALFDLIPDRARRECLGAAAQRRAERLFSRDEVAAAYLRTVLRGPQAVSVEK